MKNSFKSLLIATIAIIGIATVIPKKATAQVGVSVSFQTFYDDLSPYGQWVEDPQYGNVWVPDVDQGFRPYYTNGYWAMTEYGNTWVSDYDWGWAPFHYGRWIYNNYYGWVWIPGNEWAPAWVSWRNGGGYYGWAPLSPGISIGYSSYNCPGDWWVFVGPEYLYRHDFYRGWRGARYNDDYIRRTSFYNNVYTNQYNHTRYYYGPRADEVQRATHRPVPVYRMGNMSRPGAPRVQSNTVNMYHPQMVTGRGNDNHFAPRTVVRAPRAIGSPQPAAATNTRPAFRTDLQQHRIVPQNVQQPAQQQQQRGFQHPNTPVQQQRQMNQPPVQQQRQQQFNQPPVQQQQRGFQHPNPPVQQQQQRQQQFNQPPPPQQQQRGFQHPNPPVQQQQQQRQQQFNQPPPPQQQQRGFQHPNPPMQQQQQQRQQFNQPPPQQQQRGFQQPPVQQQQHFSPPPQQQHFNPPPQQQHFNPPPQQQHFNPPPQQQHFSPPPQQQQHVEPPHGGGEEHRR